MHALTETVEEMAPQKKLLVIDPSLTWDPSKSFYALIMKYLSRLGWSPTIVTLLQGSPAQSELRWKVVHQEKLTAPVHQSSTVQGSVGTWFGVIIVEVSPSRRTRSQVGNWLYRQRRQFFGRGKVLQADRRRRDIKAKLSAASGLALLPLTVIFGRSGVLAGSSEEIWNILMELHNQEPFSAVLSVYGDFLSHDLARRFKAHTGVPWVALIKDFCSRPAYAKRQMEEFPLFLQWLRNGLKRWHERKVLNQSTIIVAYTNVLAEYLRTIIRGVPVKVIPNCYDDEDYIDPLDSATDAEEGKFVITCVGSVQEYDLHMFFQALREINDEGYCPAMKARFVGAEEEILRSYADLYMCHRVLEILPEVPHKEAVLQMRQATCLLSPQVPYELPRRTPEYMAARRPILAFPRSPTAVSQTILKQYGGAVIASNKEEIKTTLLNWYQEFRDTGKISIDVDEELVQSFSANHRAEELNELLEELLDDQVGN